MSDAMKLAVFLDQRVEETIRERKYMESVAITYQLTESFANHIIRIFYTVTVNHRYEKLSPSRKYALFNGEPFYIYTLSKQSENNTRQHPLKLLEFKSIYESLTTAAALRLEKALGTEFPLTIQHVRADPSVNYAIQFLTDLAEDSRYLYWEDNDDAGQWASLHKLANDSRKIYTQERHLFTITDTSIKDLLGIDRYIIRRMVTEYNVPVMVKGFQTIDSLLIHVPRLLNGLKQELRRENLSFQKEDLKKLISYLYDQHLVNEKKAIQEQQQSAFIKTLSIDTGDVLLLTNGKLVVINKILFDEYNRLIIEYSQLKKNLDKSERTKAIPPSMISHFLKQAVFRDYIDQTRVRNIDLFRRWMSKKTSQLTLPVFQPDFFG